MISVTEILIHLRAKGFGAPRLRYEEFQWKYCSVIESITSSLVV